MTIPFQRTSMDRPAPLRGLHHITLLCANAQRTVDFYTHVLGLRLIKQTVNFDDPHSYHLYFGDNIGRPGTLVTFFEWPDAVPGRIGLGATHHFACCVESPEALLKWKRWLADQGVAGIEGIYDRRYFQSLYCSDPDGVIVELATRGPGWAVDEPEEQVGQDLIFPPPHLLKGGRNEAEIAAHTWPEPVPNLTADMQISGLHHLTAISTNIERTRQFFTQVLGLTVVKYTVNFDDPAAPHDYYTTGRGQPGTILTYFAYPPGGRFPRSRIGPGLTHHYALAVEDDAAQGSWREWLLACGVPVTEVLDRIYFRSIYFQDPDGHILEIATLGPGFLVDEPRESLGHQLQLPPWLEEDRQDIMAGLSPLNLEAK